MTNGIHTTAVMTAMLMLTLLGCETNQPEVNVTRRGDSQGATQPRASISTTTPQQSTNQKTPQTNSENTTSNDTSANKPADEEKTVSSEETTSVPDEEQKTPEIQQPVSDPFKVMFVIPPEYDGTGPINTQATAIQAKLYPGAKKQEIVITNMSDTPFRLHTGGRPCGHAPTSGQIMKGQSFSCVVTRTLALDPTATAAATYDHNNGRAAALFINAVEAPDPVQ